jgi:hypothetical protein
MTNKQLIYQVSIGQPSSLYKRCIASVAEYCEKYNIDHVVQTSPKLNIKPDPFNTGRSKECMSRSLPLPIFEKENAFEYFSDYDQIAIIDADIFIRDTAPNIFDKFSTNAHFGAVVERDMPLTQQYKTKILNYSHMQYSRLHPKVDFDHNPLGFEFMNMGLILMNKSITKYFRNETPREFLTRFEFKDFVDGKGPWKWSTDQTLLNWWIRKEKMNIQRLHWKWNGLYSVNNRINECHFVHFFLKDKLPNRGENVDQLMKDINENRH